MLSRSQIKATHRALRGLLRRGLIERDGHNSLGRMLWRKLGSRDRAVERIKAEIETAKVAGDQSRCVLLRSELLAAEGEGRSAGAVARYLGVSKSTVLRDLKSKPPMDAAVGAIDATK